MEAALPAEIREIDPGTVHREPRATRHVRLCVTDGPTVRVYDPGMVVTPDAVGTERDFELAAVVATVERTDERVGRIETDAAETPVFQGLVVSFDADGEEALLDVGVGTVQFDTVTLDRRVHVGDYVRLTGAIVHVEGMTPRGQPYERFLTQLEEDDAQARREAARHLGFRGSERGVDALVECYRAEAEPAVREAVITALGRLAITAQRPGESPNPRVRSTLEAATGDESELVREAADEWVARVSDYWAS